MRVTVIGGSGVLGRRVVPRLCEAGHHVTAPVRSDEAAARLPGAETPVGDVWDPAFLRRHVAGADAVMMLATSIPTGTAAARPAAWRTNDRIRGELAPKVAHIARECGVRVLVQESVMYVYRGSRSEWATEHATVDPAPPARTALIAERAARGFVTERPGGAASGARAVALRFAGFVAPDSAQTADVWELAGKGRALVFGDPAGWTTFVHVDDAAAAAVHALGVASGVYNVGGAPLTKHGWLDVMSELSGRRVRAPAAPLRRLVPRLAPPVRALERSVALDSTRLRSTGWLPELGDAAAIWAHARP